MLMKPLQWSLSFAFALACFAAPAQAFLYWTPWVSEEGGGPATVCTAWNEGAVGFGCSGSHCDKVRLLCETMPYNIQAEIATDYWTGYFSEEDSGVSRRYSVGWYPYDRDNYEVCHKTSTAGVVNGIRCKGRFCDNIALECGRPVKYKNGLVYAARMHQCAWSGWYSEEQGSHDFGWNRYITGVQCSGRYCDNKRFFVCSLQDPAP